MKIKLIVLIFLILSNFAQSQNYSKVDDNVFRYKVIISSKLPEYYFDIFVDTSENSEGIRSAAYKIDVTRSDSKKLIQIIKNFQMLLPFYPSDIQFVDINFDGYKDIILEYNRGATGNGDAHTWLYNPQKRKFIYSPDFEFDIDAEIDSVHKTIIDKWVGGVGNCDTWIYKVKKNKPVLFLETSQRYKDEYIIKTTKKYQGKKAISIKVDTVKVKD